MSHDQTMIPSEPQASTHANTAIAETLASLERRMALIEAEQREQARSIDHAIVRLAEVAERVQALHGAVLRLDHWTEMLIRDVSGARNIVIQAEHQMQQGVASINERLLDLTADVHKLRLIREAPEYKIMALKSELATVHQRLTIIESSQSPRAE